MGWTGIVLRTDTTGGTFTNNLLTNNGSGMNIAYSTGLTISGNTIIGPRGFDIAGNGFAGVGMTESHDCIQSTNPFVVGTAWSLAQWQASGHGAGTTVGTCP